METLIGVEGAICRLLEVEKRNALFVIVEMLKRFDVYENEEG